jgi:hypothetical protein
MIMTIPEQMLRLKKKKSLICPSPALMVRRRRLGKNKRKAGTS